MLYPLISNILYYRVIYLSILLFTTVENTEQNILIGSIPITLKTSSSFVPKTPPLYEDNNDSFGTDKLNKSQGNCYLLFSI